MAGNRSRYREFERFLTVILLAALALFLLYLLAAGLGWSVVKIVAAIIAILLAGFGLWNLYAAKELLKSRSLWLTCGCCSVILCTIVSLLCNFPR